jgi:hypothetical protein
MATDDEKRRRRYPLSIRDLTGEDEKNPPSRMDPWDPGDWLVADEDEEEAADKTQVADVTWGSDADATPMPGPLPQPPPIPKAAAPVHIRQTTVSEPLPSLLRDLRTPASLPVAGSGPIYEPTPTDVIPPRPVKYPTWERLLIAALSAGATFAVAMFLIVSRQRLAGEAVDFHLAREASMAVGAIIGGVVFRRYR